MGFKDGTRNIHGTDTELVDQHVWVGGETDQSWMRGGSYLVARRIQMRIEAWDRDYLADQQNVIGRHKYSGAPRPRNCSRRRAVCPRSRLWLDEVNRTAEFEPVGTHPRYRRMGLARAATHMKVACLGAPGHPQARGLYFGVGFRELTRDAPLIRTRTAGCGPVVHRVRFLRVGARAPAGAGLRRIKVDIRRRLPGSDAGGQDRRTCASGYRALEG